MPELPEVETVMRGLQARLEGRVIVRALVHRADLRWALPPDLAQRLTGARVLGFRRRAKYMLMRLEPREGGGGDSVLLHLGMSGRMVLGPLNPNSITRHEHIVLETDDGWRVGFVDPRRFGSVDLVATAREDEHRLLAGLGPEPLDQAFSTTVLARSLAGKRTPVKAALLDQRVVAGLGNIYVCEALFRASIAPDRQAATIPRAGAARLVRRDQGDARGGDRRRWLLAAGLRAAGRRAGLFPARLEGVWARRPALRALPWPAGLRRGGAHGAVGTFHLPLPAHAAVTHPHALHARALSPPHAPRYHGQEP